MKSVFLPTERIQSKKKKAQDKKQEEKVELQKADRQYNQALQELDLDNPDKQVHRLEKLYEPIKENTEAAWDANLMLEIKRQKGLDPGERNNQENIEKKQKLISETEKKHQALFEQVQQSPENNETNQETIANLANDLYVSIEGVYAQQVLLAQKNEQIRLAEEAENTARQTLVTAQNELQQVTQTIADLEVEVQQLTDKNNRLDTLNQRLGQDAAQIQGNINRLDQELNLQQGQVGDLLAEVGLEKQQLEELNQQLQQNQQQIGVLDEQINNNNQPEIQNFTLRMNALVDQIERLPAPTHVGNEEEKQSDPEVDRQRHHLEEQMTQLQQEQQHLAERTRQLELERENHTQERDRLQESINPQFLSVTDGERRLEEASQNVQRIQNNLNDLRIESQQIQGTIDQNQQAIIANEQSLAAIHAELENQRTALGGAHERVEAAENELARRRQERFDYENERVILNEKLEEFTNDAQRIRNDLLGVDPEKKAERLVWLKWLAIDGIDKMLQAQGDILTAVPNAFRTEYGAKLGYNRLVKHYAEKAGTVKKSFDKLLSKNNKDQFKERLYNLYQDLALGNISPEKYHADIQAFQEEFEKYKDELNEMNQAVQAMTQFCRDIDQHVPEENLTPEEKALLEDYNSLRRTLFSMTGNPVLVKPGEGLTGPTETLEAYITSCNSGLPYQEERKELTKRVDKMRYRGEARDTVPYSLASLQRQFKPEEGSAAAIQDAIALNKELSVGLATRDILGSCNIDQNTMLNIAHVDSAVDNLNDLRLQTEDEQQPISLYTGVSSFEPREGLGLELQRIEETLEACYTNAQKFHEELKALDQARLALELRYPDDGGRVAGSAYEAQANELKQHALRIQLQLVEISAVAEVAKNRYKRLTPANCRFPYWGSAANQTGTGDKVFDTDVLSEKVREKLYLNPSSTPSKVYGENADDTHGELKYHEIHAPRINRLFYYLSGQPIYMQGPAPLDEQQKIVRVLHGGGYNADMFNDRGNHATADVNAAVVGQTARAVAPDTDSYRYYQPPQPAP